MSGVEHVRMSSSSSGDESPKTKVGNSSNNSSKSNKGVSDVPSTKRFAGSGIDFKGKLIGAEEVAEARGDKLCQIAMAKLKAGVKASGEHKQRIVVNVSMEGIKIVDDKSAEVLHVHELNRISFISRDTGDSRAFGYIYRRNDGSHQFLGIKTEKAAETLILSLRDLFQAAFETKKNQEAETTSSSAGDAVDTETGAKSEANEEQSRPTEKSEATSKEGDESTTAENLLNFEVEFQNLSRGTGTAPPVSPIWTIVDPWKPSSMTQQPPAVGVVGLPVMGVGGSPQLYPGSTLLVSPYGFTNTAVRQAPPPGMSPFSGSPWPARPQQQQVSGVDSFVASSTGTPLSAPSHPNSTVLGSADSSLIPSHVGGGASPSLGNPFMATTAAASTASATNDPFAKLATGLLGATPASHQPGKRRPDKSDFFTEPAKPSLLHLSQQQQQQQQQERGDDVRQMEQQTNVDLFGATPFSAALTTIAPVNDPFARIE